MKFVRYGPARREKLGILDVSGQTEATTNVIHLVVPAPACAPVGAMWFSRMRKRVRKIL